MTKQATTSVSKVVFSGSIEGKTVSVAHVFRRRYEVTVAGKTAGYVTSKDPMNAVGRIASITKLADLKSRLH